MHSPRSTSASASVTSSPSRRLFPTPDSPLTITTPGVPARARASASRAAASSAARPMKLGLETLLATTSVSRPPGRPRLSVAEVLQTIQLLPVPRDAALALGGQLEPRVRLLAHEPLLDRQKAALLELGEVAREVALGQPGRALEEEEVGIAHRGEDGQDREPARLVDEPVEHELVLSHRSATWRGPSSGRSGDGRTRR